MDRKYSEHETVEALAAIVQTVSKMLKVDLLVIADNAELFAAILPAERKSQESVSLLLKAAFMHAEQGLADPAQAYAFCVSSLTHLFDLRAGEILATDEAHQRAADTTDAIISTMKKEV